jgi:hypothetical protein
LPEDRNRLSGRDVHRTDCAAWFNTRPRHW